ncbi:neck protein [Paraglaciecola Antarctic GD virus 1]|nr:neck protein [Paraglaciecola Antarctic GD virus 1]
MAIHKISGISFAKLESQKGYGGTEGTQENWVVNPVTGSFMKSDSEKDLLHSLTMESIQTNGIEAYYIYREKTDPDLLFGEDPTGVFDLTFKIAIYIDSFDEYGGDGDIYSKFGYTVNDEMSFTVSPFLFNHQVNNESNKPREGDLIYFPLGKAIFEITFVEDEKPWYPNGTLPQLKVNAQKFTYSNETVELVDTVFGSEIGDVGQVPQFIIDDIESINGITDTDVVQYEQADDIADEADGIISEDDNPFT